MEEGSFYIDCHDFNALATLTIIGEKLIISGIKFTLSAQNWEDSYATILAKKKHILWLKEI